MASKFNDYVVNFAVGRIRNSIITSAVELVPWLGDLSPSWTIKAWLHIREHRKIARELKAKNIEFENSLTKWRGSLRIGGVRFQSKANSIPNRQTTTNNFRPINSPRVVKSPKPMSPVGK